jgi:IPT/TIG domain
MSSISSLSPSSCNAGASTFTLTVYGSGFATDGTEIVRWNGSSLSTTPGTHITISATVTASLVATAGTASVDTSESSNTSTFTVLAVNPSPTLSGISPTSASLGATGTLTATGSNFVVGQSVIQWDGSTVSSSNCTSTTTITCSFNTSLAVVGPHNVTVFTPGPGGGTSGTKTFTITRPTVSSLSPSSADAGGSGFTITVTGANFDSTARVIWNGSARALVGTPTSTTVKGAILSSDIAKGSAGIPVTVDCDGYEPTGLPLYFVVNNPAPVIGTVSPTSILAGSGDTTITVTGNNIVSSSRVRWDGSDLSTSYISGSKLQAVVPASYLTSAHLGSHTIQIWSPGPGGGLSGGGVVTVKYPAPTISSISPGSALVGASTFDLTVSGSQFISGCTVLWNASTLVTTFGNSTSVTASVPSSLLTTAGTATIKVKQPDGTTSAGVTFYINSANPSPTISSISPSSATAGDVSFTLTVNCTDASYVAGSVVQWAGSNRVTTYINSGQLTAAISFSDIASAGTVAVTVFNPAPGGGTSAATTFTINAPNPVPTISSISPASATTGSGDFTLTVNGTNFISSSTVNWNGSGLTTTFVNSTQVTAAVPGADIASDTTASVTVVNPTPGGGTSNSKSFVASSDNPLPAITSISPTVKSVGDAAFTLTVNGTGFISGSVVKWDGSSLSTTYVSGTQITADVTTTQTAVAGSHSITVYNSAPGGGTSNAATILINTPSNPVPVITSISPDSTDRGGSSFTLSVLGENFLSTTNGYWNGSARTTTYVSPTQVNLSITDTDIGAALGIVTKVNPYFHSDDVTTNSQIVRALSDGSVSRPSLTVGSGTDTDTGIYHPDQNTIAIAAGGLDGIKITASPTPVVTISGAYKLPSSDGTAGQVPQTDGAGTVTWADQSGGGGGGGLADPFTWMNN